MIDVFMIREIIKIDIDQIFNLVIEYNMDRITEVDQGMNKIIEMTIRGNFRGNVRVYQNQNFRGRNNLIEMDIGEIIEIKYMKEVGLGLEKEYFQRVIIEEMKEAQAIVDQGQDQE